MALPVSNRVSSLKRENSIPNEPRSILSGDISDEFGKGKFAFCRTNQIGFCAAVDYDSQVSGIAVINNFSDASNTNNNVENSISVGRMLEYRYSVIADTGCKVDCLKVSLSCLADAKARMSVSITWRGSGTATLIDPDDQILDRKNGSLLRQNENIVLECDPDLNSTWYIEVPSHSLSVLIRIDEQSAIIQQGKISIVVDTLFLDMKRNLNVSTVGNTNSGTGKIQPGKVLEIIEQVEETVEQSVIDETRPISSISAVSKNDNGVNCLNTSPSEIDKVVSQKITVFYGEDIILGTEGMFCNRITCGACYVSASLPDWLFLDQKSGDLMGTVPVKECEERDLEFSIYAVDEIGNSAKAVILVKCLSQKQGSEEEFKDYEYRDSDKESIAVNGMFFDFGPDEANLAADLNEFVDCFSVHDMRLPPNDTIEDVDHPAVPMVRAFTPERHVYLQIHPGDENSVRSSDYKFQVKLPDLKELPDWIEYSSTGIIRIECNPDRRYVDLELTQLIYDGIPVSYDICIDTFEGNILPMHHQSSASIDQQVQQVSAAYK